MKKILFLILTLGLLTGCGSDYELKVNKYSIEEKAQVKLKNNDYDKAVLLNEIFRVTNINYDDDTEMGKYVIDQLRNNKLSPGYNLDGNLNKKITNNKISLSYTYKNDEFSSSNIFNSCFKDTYYDSTDDYYIIKGYNSFKCMIKDKMQISIKSDYRVIDSNADKVKGNKYIWYFNRNNNTDHDLYIQISKKYMAPKPNYWGITFLLAIAIGFIIYKFFIKKDRINFRSNNEV